MGTIMAVVFAKILTAKYPVKVTQHPIFWFFDGIIPLLDGDKIKEFLLKANSFNPTIKFTAEISETETNFLDTIVYKG